jgi:hypothetical protein
LLVTGKNDESLVRLDIFDGVKKSLLRFCRKPALDLNGPFPGQAREFQYKTPD